MEKFPVSFLIEKNKLDLVTLCMSIIGKKNVIVWYLEEGHYVPDKFS